MFRSFNSKKAIVSIAFGACSLLTLSVSTLGTEPELNKSKSARVGKESWSPDDGLVVHEWGTFTSFSGSDGAFLEFRPLHNEISDLPGFVWNRFGSDQDSIFAKSRIRGRVRMETPVLYFYTDRIQEMTAKVDFPKGLLTEFYPPVKTMLPAFDSHAAHHEGEPIGKSSLDWGTFTLIPKSSLIPEITDPTKREPIVNLIEASAYPKAARMEHYAAARATESAMVHVTGPESFAGQLGSQGTSYVEKFLFYRGVGSFDQPIHVEFESNNSPRITNNSDQTIAGAMMLKVDGESLWLSSVRSIAPKETIKDLTLKNVEKAQLEAVVSDLLTAQGLYRDEANAMVQTWQSSWFTEEGTRLFYIVPPATTDTILPLQLEPAPKSLVRVLVGRLDLLPPSEEQQAIQAMIASAKTRKTMIEAGEQSVHLLVPNSIAKYGRMAEPILTRVSQVARDQTVRLEAEALIVQNYTSN